MKKPERDYRGLKLCDTCWNGQHYGYMPKKDSSGRTLRGKGTKYCKCKGIDGCQCPCRELFEEQKKPQRKAKLDHKLQVPMFPENQNAVGL